MDTYTLENQASPTAVTRPRRQMRTIETKLRIVQETLKPGVSVAEVARRHGVNANLLFSWRRQHAQGVLEHTRPPRAVQLLPVKVTSPINESTASDTIEIALPCGARVRVLGEVSVVDDADMRITHVIRGDDHVNNTPRQINIF